MRSSQCCHVLLRHVWSSQTGWLNRSLWHLVLRQLPRAVTFSRASLHTFCTSRTRCWIDCRLKFLFRYSRNFHGRCAECAHLVQILTVDRQDVLRTQTVCIKPLYDTRSNHDLRSANSSSWHLTTPYTCNIWLSLARRP